MKLNAQLLLALGATAVFFDEAGEIDSWLPVDLDTSEAAVLAATDKLLAQAKAAKWESIKSERDHRKAGGFKVGTLWFHSDADSRIQHLGLKDKARDLIAAGGAMTDNLTILGQPVR